MLEHINHNVYIAFLYEKLVIFKSKTQLSNSIYATYVPNYLKPLSEFFFQCHPPHELCLHNRYLNRQMMLACRSAGFLFVYFVKVCQQFFLESVQSSH